MYDIKGVPNFKEDKEQLDPQVKKRVLNKIKWLAKNPSQIPAPMKYLPEDLTGLRRYRVGDWRVLFWVKEDEKMIILYGVKHRKEVYDNL